MRHVNWPAVFAIFGIVLLLTVLDRYRALHRWPFDVGSLDEAQAQFERNNPEWNWAGWKSPEWDHFRGEGLTCKSKDTVRSCSVMVPEPPDPKYPEAYTGHRLMLFVCSTTECDWVLTNP